MNQSLVPVPSGVFQVSGSPINQGNVDEAPLKFSLVLPTYKEAGNIQDIVKILTDLLDQSIAGDYELIVVDDNSPDHTWKLALELTSDYPQLKVMRRTEEKGLSTAVIRGWQVARGNILGVIDADLQHPPEVLQQLLGEMDKGADLAVASRHVEGGGVSEWSIIRRFLSRGAQMLGLIILPEVIGRLSDPMSGYFMVRRTAIAGKPLSPVGYKILIEVTARGKIRWLGEAGYVFRERQAGESKVTWKQYIEYLQHLVRLRLSLSARFIQFCLVGFSGLFVDLTVFSLLRKGLELGLTRSTILSAEVAIINNFLWNDLWTFRDISSRQPGKRQRLKRFIKFNFVCLAGVILQTLLVNTFFAIFQKLQLDTTIANITTNGFLRGVLTSDLLAKLMAIVIVTFWNFWLNTKLSWRVTDIER
ncbi:glycosyltransferase [Crocosphaera watsonii WH 8501]|uniref:Dolichol-phosphate mannosyltransferase n=5 Tax=Crocosphaera watsonii TaxID=263511 RepID=Q4CAT7_CROWT|nr:MULTISPECIES: glycosyltransferase [Crocosphaera]EAM52849.1 Dolichyl-phosphate beta-D-mannosyltransferase [Crocosphaera watsonii WH 8501]EHJ15192.1 dolichyl-phosphate-mannose synthase [Crocosphaera watsonii WH 0003]MCH2243240.1 glycosyltransferase [Crocosphaera sp.]NQZ64353.1 glycosyltransferase [Crocosphaera sp.]CCQ53556.1 Dolichol-phosphate mannosyltransferase [Crocosphaera watsonii WH 8502]